MSIHTLTISIGTSSPQNKTELCDTKQFTNTTPLRMQDILVLILNLGHISQNI